MKLNQVRRHDRARRAFGAQKHRYRVNPRVSSTQLDRLEQRYQLSFPDDYRLFLQEVGNGGAGPFYGLLPVEEALELGPSLDWAASDAPGPADYFEQPFIPPVAVADEAPWETLLALRGLLPLAQMGDGGYIHLVVSGPERGHLWATYDGTFWVWPVASSLAAIPSALWSALRDHDRVNFQLSPAFTDRVTFLRWYEQWLDETLAE